MRIQVKICGIRDTGSAGAAVEAGADAVGFVLTDSVRRISPALAAEIAAGVPGHVDKVAVFLRPSPAEIRGVLEVFRPDVVQADHDAIDGFDFPRLLPVFRVVRDTGVILGGDMRDRRFLYEGERSGVGHVADWVVATELAALGPMTLAGGLTPDNVAEAIRTVRPYGVDVSSGVESEPGVKDHGLIRQFVEAVRETERELVSK